MWRIPRSLPVATAAGEVLTSMGRIGDLRSTLLPDVTGRGSTLFWPEESCTVQKFSMAPIPPVMAVG